MVSRAVTTSIGVPERAAAGSGGTLPALRSLLGVQGFLTLCLGNGIAHSGPRLQSTVIAWLVLEMTGSKLMLGVVIGAPVVAIVGASLAGGVLADSSHAVRALRWTRLTMAGAILVAGLLVSTGQVEIGFLMAVVFVGAIASAIDMPVGRTLVFDMVGRERALSGTAMSSMAMNLCAVAGPLAVGLLMSSAGVDTAFYAIAVAYTASALLIPQIRRQGSAREISPLQELGQGLTYLRNTPCVAWLISLFFLVPLAGVFFAMVPVFAHEVLEVGPAGLGVMMAAWGAGTVLGSGYLVVNGQLRNRGAQVTVLGVLFGAGMVAFSASGTLAISVGIAFVMGIIAMLWQNTLSAMVQAAATPEMKGRAMSVGTMGIQLQSLGWLAGGAGSAVAGPVATVVIAGVGFAALSGFVFAKSADVRAID